MSKIVGGYSLKAYEKGALGRMRLSGVRWGRRINRDQAGAVVKSLEYHGLKLPGDCVERMTFEIAGQRAGEASLSLSIVAIPHLFKNPNDNAAMQVLARHSAEDICDIALKMLRSTPSSDVLDVLSRALLIRADEKEAAGGGASIRLFSLAGYLDHVREYIARAGGSKEVAIRRIQVAGKELRAVNHYSAGVLVKGLGGLQEANFIDLFGYTATAGGLSILEPDGKAVEQRDGTVTAKVRGEERAIEGLAQFMRTQATFWLFSERKNRAEQNSENWRIASGFAPDDPLLVMMIEAIARNWGESVLTASIPGRKEGGGECWRIGMRTFAEHFSCAGENVRVVLSEGERCVENDRGLTPFAYLSRLRRIPLMNFCGGGSDFMTKPVYFDRFAWIESVRVSGE